MRFPCRPICLVLLLLALGCSGPKIPKTVPVSGRVTMDGKPLVNALVMFSPEDSKNQRTQEASGFTDENGSYSLKLNINGTPGVAPGRYVVHIGKMDLENAKGQVIPEAYNTNSTMTCDVPAGGKTDADYNLSSTGR